MSQAADVSIDICMPRTARSWEGVPGTRKLTRAMADVACGAKLILS